jgi:hypothetical protein
VKSFQVTALQEGTLLGLALYGRIPILVQPVRRIWRRRMRDCLHDHHHVQYLLGPRRSKFCVSLLFLSRYFIGGRVSKYCALSVRGQDKRPLRYVSRRCKLLKLNAQLCKQRKRPLIPSTPNAPTRRRWSAAVFIACGPYTVIYKHDTASNQYHNRCANCCCNIIAFF